MGQGGAVETVVVEHVDSVLRDRLEQIWYDVSEAGGAVGFVPPVERRQVADLLDASLAEVAAGRRLLVLLRVDSDVAGFGFLSRSDRDLFRHFATVTALQVHPRHQGSGLGRVLLEGMHDLAADKGVELLHLTYRDGMGLGGFYTALGYREVGRIPGAIRVAPGDDRDEVLMVRPLS